MTLFCIGADLHANATSNGIYPWACQENNPVGLPINRSTNDSFHDVTTAYDATIAIEATTSQGTLLRGHR